MIPIIDLLSKSTIRIFLVLTLGMVGVGANRTDPATSQLPTFICDMSCYIPLASVLIFIALFILFCSVFQMVYRRRHLQLPADLYNNNAVEAEFLPAYSCSDNRDLGIPEDLMNALMPPPDYHHPPPPPSPNCPTTTTSLASRGVMMQIGPPSYENLPHSYRIPTSRSIIGQIRPLQTSPILQDYDPESEGCSLQAQLRESRSAPIIRINIP